MPANLPEYLKTNDEFIFQEARRLVIAEWQNVIYGEFLPIVLGPDLMSKFFLSSSLDTGYFPQFNPSIIHAFSTAAFR